MAQVSLTVRDDLMAEVLDAFDATFPRAQGDNKQQHMRKQLKAHIKSVLMHYRTNTAVEAARKAVVDPGDLETA